MRMNDELVSRNGKVLMEISISPPKPFKMNHIIFSIIALHSNHMVNRYQPVVCLHHFINYRSSLSFAQIRLMEINRHKF